MDNQDYESNENMPSQTSQGDVTFESKKGDIQGKGKTDKKGLDILLKRKSILLIAAVIMGLFLLLFGSFLMEGSDVHNYLYYKNGKDLLSKKVTVHYRKFGEEEETTTQMDLEEYVSKAVYAYSKDIRKIEEKNENRHDYHLYWALAIALRNEALTNNFTVTYHDDKDLFANYEKDEQIDYALDLAKNLVIVNLKDELISTHVSNYCWSKIHETEPVHVLFHNDLFIPNDFSNDYITNRVYNECECNKSSGIIESSEPFDDEDPQCWIYFEEEITTETENDDGTTDTDTEIIYKKEYLHQEEQTGFNLSAAYYYWHEPKYNYNFLQMLTVFYGNDININTLEDKNNLEDEKTLAYEKGNQSSFCNTSSSTANFETFLNQWEGNEGLCNNDTGYYAKKLKDSADYTVGYGVTEYDIRQDYMKTFIDEHNWGSYFRVTSKGLYDLNPGDCVPIEVIDSIREYALEQKYNAAVLAANEKYHANLTQYQIDALTDLNYNRGTGVDEAVKAYTEGGYEALWNVIKTNLGKSSQTDASIKLAMQKRRKGEFALFVTGDYTDQGKFYDHRDAKDYDNYNSEGVMEKQAQCANGGKDGFALPFTTGTNFSCTSPYGNRIHPITGVFHSHSGLDLGAASGTDILASKAGEVAEVGFGHASMGNYVKIKHDDGMQTVYMHMLNNSIVVTKGQKVSQGEKIGEVGMTGSATGPHLHITIKDVSGNTVDPYDYLDLSMLSDTSRCHLGGESSS